EYNETSGNSKKTGIRKIDEDKMFHVRGKRLPECDRGLSPIFVLKNTLGSAMAGERVSGEMLKDGLLPQLIISADQVLQADQRKQIYAVLEEFAKSDGKKSILPL